MAGAASWLAADASATCARDVLPIGDSCRVAPTREFVRWQLSARCDTVGALFLCVGGELAPAALPALCSLIHAVWLERNRGEIWRMTGPEVLLRARLGGSAGDGVVPLPSAELPAGSGFELCVTFDPARLGELGKGWTRAALGRHLAGVLVDFVLELAGELEPPAVVVDLLADCGHLPGPDGRALRAAIEDGTHSVPLVVHGHGAHVWCREVRGPSVVFPLSWGAAAGNWVAEVAFAIVRTSDPCRFLDARTTGEVSAELVDTSTGAVSKYGRRALAAVGALARGLPVLAPGVYRVPLECQRSTGGAAIVADYAELRVGVEKLPGDGAFRVVLLVARRCELRISLRSCELVSARAHRR